MSVVRGPEVVIQGLTATYQRHPAVHHLSARFAPGSLTRATLRLASTVFMDPRTGALFSYPHVLRAPALDARPSQRGRDPKQLTVRAECARVVRRMAELAGLDPCTTTAPEMDELDAWYYYPDADKPRQRRALPWRYVVRALPRRCLITSDHQTDEIGHA